MPHICRKCKTCVDAVEGLAPRCPTCGGSTFSFISARRMSQLGEQEPAIEKNQSLLPADEASEISEPSAQNSKTEPEKSDNCDSVESIRIIEPGRYDLNLLKLAESDDRVIRIGKDANYRLDLHSMVRPKKKE